MSEALQTWQDVITNYIDGLEEKDKQKQYVDELVAIFLAKELLLAKSDDNEKECQEQVRKIEKIPVTSSNRKKFEVCYSEMLAKRWVDDLSPQMDRIKKKSDFYNIWICRTVELSQGVLPATHCAKLSHASCSGSSIMDRSKSKKDAFLTTNSLNTEIIDGTYLNAERSKQVKFLMLRHGKINLFDAINDDSKADLNCFADSNEELEYWLQSYKKILNKIPATDILLKQIYFPVSHDYHLLSVLKSSSLAQKIYESHFSKEARKPQEEFKKAKKSNKYLQGTFSQMVVVNKLFTTQSQPQNATVLNGKRGGALRLFSTQPPIWQSELKPPLYYNSWFDRGIPYNTAQEDIDYLRSFLLRNDNLALSTRDPVKRKWLIKWGQSITDSVLFYAQNIQNLPAGWSHHPDIKLKPEQQYFLDPYRDDEDFQGAKKASDWQKVVSSDFAKWLNKKLVGRDKKFTPQAEHRKLWTLLMVNALRELEPMLDLVQISNQEEHA